MKTRFSTIFLFFLSSILFSQNTIEKTIGEFSELKVYDLIQVDLINSNENKVIITGENAKNVLVNNKNGVLKIKMSIKEAFDGNKTFVKLFYTSVDVVDVNEGATVRSEDVIKQFEIDLKAQEGGTIQVPINTTYTNVKAVTGGVVTTTGSSKNQNISLLTGGQYHGSKLKTENTEVSINAAGESHVNASKLVDVKIRVGGDVFIYGNPEMVKESKVLGGRVKRM